MNHQEMLEWERLSLRYDENAIPLYLSYPVESFWKQQSSLEDYVRNCKVLISLFFIFIFPIARKSVIIACAIKRP